jgi:hypothetical protein
MAVYLKKFENHSAYQAAQSSLILPNVSLCVQENEVHYNPSTPPTPTETRVVAKFNVTDTSTPTPISFKANWADGTSGFSVIEIDGVEQPSVVSAYTFDTLGEHTVKYTLTDPTNIGEWAFRECRNLTSIVIPDGVTSVGQNAFDVCNNLLSIDLPNSVTSIGEWAFANCPNLTRLNSNADGVFNIPSGVTSINGGTFAQCSSLTSCTIGNNVTSIEHEAFSLCERLASINIPSGVTFIGSGAFCGCDSLDATTVATIEAIYPDAFYCS